MRKLGDAWLILLINAIWRSIKGARQSRTPNPQPIMNGNQGMPVYDCVDTRTAAVMLKAGANQCHIIGSENYFLGLAAF